MNRILLSICLAAGPAFAQSEAQILTPEPRNFIGRFLRPFHFEKRVVPPVKLANTTRLESLVRGGNLYLSKEDVIALVLENNLDIAVQRYNPLLAREVLRSNRGVAVGVENRNRGNGRIVEIEIVHLEFELY